jgi:hypothetical protein
MGAGVLERYFAALDGPHPTSVLELVSDDLRFAILYSTDTTDASKQFLGGARELVDYLAARDPQGATHHIVSISVVGDVEHVLGEARYPDGTVAAAFVAAGQIGPDGKLLRYITARSPGLDLEPG